jgi:Domain of unknown function (DUF4783)
MRLKIILVFLNFFGFLLVTDNLDAVSNALKKGNAKDLSAFFAASIDLKLNEKEGVYSKAQAEMILNDFFSKNQIKTFTIIHKSVTKNLSQYVIGRLETTPKKYRIYLLLKSSDNNSLIQQIRIEEDNE